jgi:hypothetical protein
MAQSSDISILFKLTTKLYYSCFVKAGKLLVSKISLIFLQLALVIILGVLLRLTSLMGMAGGFMAGLLLAVALAGYFASIEVAVTERKIVIADIWPLTMQIFSPTLSVLFAYFVISLLLSFLLTGPSGQEILSLLGMVMAVALNPLPETIYQRGGQLTTMVSESFLFVKENFVEWFAPILIVFIPLGLFFGPRFVLLFLQNPIFLLQRFIGSLGAFTNVFNILFVLIYLAVIFFIFIFRGLLFKELSTSTRRKRIYQFKMGQ